MNDYGDPVSRRARQLNRDVAETPLWSDNKVVNVASSMVMFLGQAYLGGVVVGHRSGEGEEHSRLGIGRKGVRFEAKVSDRVYLEDRIAGGAVNRGLRCGVGERRGHVAAKNFAGVL